MKRFRIPLLRKLIREELGQTAVVVALTITSMLALAGASVDVGHIYYAYRLLVASTNSAALAGAQTMSTAILETTSGAAYTAAVGGVVQQYSSASGGLNASTFLQNDQVTTTSFYCSSTMQGSPFNVVCEVPPGSTAGINAIKVTQTAQVPLWFGGLIGIPKMNLWATASAAMRGGFNVPYNLAIIMDTTASMAQTVSHDPNCTTSQITCAVSGFKTMLLNMAPCSGGSNCSTSTPYVDDVALFVFPAVSTKYSANNYSQDYCSTLRSSDSVPYNFVNVTPGTTQNLNMEASGTDAGAYEIIPFNDLYKQSDASTTLLASSSLAEAVGENGCGGLSAPGGQGTYYAQVIYSAQSALETAQANLEASMGSAYAGSKNVMIILSDGDATACGGTNANTAAGACSNSAQIVAENNPGCTNVKTNGNCLNGTGTSATNPTGYNNPAYPSALGECGQAVQAAQAATAAGTIVYTIGFGTESSGCTTDKTYTVSSSATNGAEAWPGGPNPRSPCNAIAAMASTANTFYSDNTNGCPALITANSGNSLQVDFEEIVAGLTSPRMIPNGTP